ncbi:hypothetical protein [Halorussus aquaticus]|uniref:Uncharacterized protein n=1 Tax=Halorussus aquaticus TaxID=2953748 RepID=A0ABD5PZ36_9EURY|nr:hypothetical protein [Halorussus aquaticus]
MTLSAGWDKTEKVNVVTAIPGYSENSSSGGKPTNSAIPTFFDDWFHGDNRQSLPSAQSSALGSKSLEEYGRTFPNYRVKTSVEIGFDTSGQSIPSYEVQMAQPSKLAEITLEGGPGESNPFRSVYDLDGSQNYLPAGKKGPKTTQKTVTVDGVQGVRGSIIFGGNDTYLSRAKNQGLTLGLLFSGNIPAALVTYFTALPAFYAFVDFAFMADGTKLVRVWDVSYYPAHALYVGGTRRDQTTFREGTEWTRDGANDAFDTFAAESLIPGRTPFDTLGSFGYKTGFRSGAGSHPAMDYANPGTTLSIGAVENALSSPLFPPL